MSSSSSGFLSQSNERKKLFFYLGSQDEGRRTFQRPSSRTSCSSGMYSWPSLSKSARVFVEEAEKGTVPEFPVYKPEINIAEFRTQQKQKWGESQRLIIRSEGDQLIILASRRHAQKKSLTISGFNFVFFSFHETTPHSLVGENKKNVSEESDFRTGFLASHPSWPKPRRARYNLGDSEFSHVSRIVISP